MKKLPIGISNFKELIVENYYYVDKTEFVSEILDTSPKIILLPRPRRFGKTLNLSMLNYFFSVENSNKTLFDGLNISKNQSAMKHFNRYPIIYISFKDVKEKNFEKSLNKIKRLVSNEFRKHYKIIMESDIESIDRKIVDKIIIEEASEVDIGNSFKLLSKLLTIAYNQKCIVLIDEYDTPIQTGFMEGYYKDIVDFFKTFMGAVLKDNDTYIYKAVLTGILRVSKESIFSDLNNIKVYTLLDDEFNDIFGFTTNEVKSMLEEYELADRFEEVEKWYDGYTIGDCHIYNPWSLLNYADSKKFDVYWANTSSNGIIRTLVENSEDFRGDLKLLLKGQSVERVINPNITFRDKDFNFKEEMLYSFLFFSGYLKYTSRKFNEGEHLCQLAIVNQECQYIFKNIISNWISDSFSNRKLRILLKSLTEGDLPLFERIFSEFVRDTLSFYDTGKNIESVYHAFFLGLLVNLGDYEVISNQEAGYGRVDIILLHKEDKKRLAIVIELKIIDDFIEETKERALESAVEQIKEKEYVALVKKREYENILSFGVVFDGKRVWVKKLEE